MLELIEVKVLPLGFLQSPVYTVHCATKLLKEIMVLQKRSGWVIFRAAQISRRCTPKRNKRRFGQASFRGKMFVRFQFLPPGQSPKAGVLRGALSFYIDCFFEKRRPDAIPIRLKRSASTLVSASSAHLRGESGGRARTGQDGLGVGIR